MNDEYLQNIIKQILEPYKYKYLNFKHEDNFQFYFVFNCKKGKGPQLKFVGEIAPGRASCTVELVKTSYQTANANHALFNELNQDAFEYRVFYNMNTMRICVCDDIRTFDDRQILYSFERWIAYAHSQEIDDLYMKVKPLQEN